MIVVNGVEALLGGDVSAFQGDLGDNDLDFVIAKASEGPDWRDANFEMHVRSQHARGKLVLAYHFGHNGEGAAGARNFLAAIAPVLNLLSGVCLDVEFQDAASTIGPTYADVLAWNQTVAAALPSMRRYLYTAAFYWAYVLGNPPAPAGMPLWWAHMVPDYNNPDPHQLAAQTTDPPRPDIPWADWAIRQIGWNGTVGSQHPVDIDLTFMSREQLAGTSGPTPTPPQPEDDMTPAQEAKIDNLVKAAFVTYVKLADHDKRLDAVGRILETGQSVAGGKVDHEGLAQITAQLSSLAAEVAELKSLLTPKAAS